MTLVRWSPLGLTSGRDFVRMRVDQLFESLLNPARGPAAAFAPPVEIEENAEEFVVRADLPGISQKDVKIQLTGEVLTIRGERRQEQTEKNGNLHRSERVYGGFERSFTLNAPVHGEKVRATYKDGVLEVHIPKAEEARVREIPIQAS